MIDERSSQDKLIEIYHRFHVALLALEMIEDTLNEVAAVHQIVHLCDHKDVGVLRIHRVLRVNIVGDLAGTVDGVLVVTTKENILKQTRFCWMFPSVVTYLMRDETVRLHRGLYLDVSQIQLHHRSDTLLHVSGPTALDFGHFNALELKLKVQQIESLVLCERFLCQTVMLRIRIFTMPRSS